MKRIVIDGRLNGESGGGIGTVVKGLIEGFADKKLENIEIIAVLNDSTREYAKNINGTSLFFEFDNKKLKFFGKFKRKVKFACRAFMYLTKINLPTWMLFESDELISRLKPDVVHLPFQTVYGSSIPTIYQPHDLQHKHLPQYFGAVERFKRNINYNFMCLKSTQIVVTSQYVKDDLITMLNVPEPKIRVIQLAPLFSSLVEKPILRKLVEQEAESTFLLYPAVNWPHKNHLRLLQAVSNLKKKEIKVRIVLTGYINSKYENPMETARKLGIESQVFVMGHVSTDLLDFLYWNCEAVIVPTLFEAASFPIWEAFSRSKPVACSNVTSLPEQVGPSALVFDPWSVEEIENSIELIWTKPDLREHLGKLGKIQLSNLSWQKTTNEFLELYREILEMTNAK
jgi:glycosyltransferase involved in cell wall biosynthesis